MKLFYLKGDKIKVYKVAVTSNNEVKVKEETFLCDNCENERTVKLVEFECDECRETSCKHCWTLIDNFLI